ncbi:MAG: peptide chain release factor 2 [Anaerovoracaceae bacterium]
MQIADIKMEMPELKKMIMETRGSLDPDSLNSEIEKLSKESEEEGFWNDQEKAQKVLKKKKQLENKLNEFETVYSAYEDLEVLLEMAEEDSSMEKELDDSFVKLKKEIEDLRIKTLLSGEYDANSAILSINAGAGGTDAQDWAEILLRMYTRWAEEKKYKVKTLDLNQDTVDGIKSVTLAIEGEYAYGYLKAEKGVHRLVRISPYDSNARRHTSFASVEVMPEIEDDLSVEIDPDDIRIDTFRSSGAGGQHVNKTDSAIRITHLPTKIAVSCQNERSQHQNKDTAMKLLISKLVDLKEQEHKENLNEIKGDFSKIEWGSQIRSYVFHPYTMVKDHRTGAEVGNVDKVLDGDLDYFINEKLKAK